MREKGKIKFYLNTGDIITVKNVDEFSFARYDTGKRGIIAVKNGKGGFTYLDSAEIVAIEADFSIIRDIKGYVNTFF